MLSAAVGIGGTLLVQHRDDELQVSTVGMATYFAEAWGHAIFKAYNDDKTGLNEGILISEWTPSYAIVPFDRRTDHDGRHGPRQRKIARRLERHGASQQFPAPTTTITPMT